MVNKEEVAEWFRGLQDRICKAIEDADGSGKFIEDKWTRAEGGGGRTRVMQHGTVLEKGGVAFSAVHGPTPDNILQAFGLNKADFFATGVSIVLHPNNPMVPIIHMNVRYFEMTDGTCWFGGGIDLTPHYIVDEDARHFHSELQKTCDRFHPSYYTEFRNWADDYFFIKHRNETRGIGGIFFDKLQARDGFTMEDRFEFVKAVGETFAPVYTHFMKKNKDLPYSEEQKKWQMLRRGRYVEFNLVYDKGTKFGLDTGGRIESILMSLPEAAGWFYNYAPAHNSPEERTLSLLRKGIHWV